MTSKPPRPLKFYTVPEIAELLGVSERTVWRWLKERELRLHRFGKSVPISEGDLYDFLGKNRED